MRRVWCLANDAWLGSAVGLVPAIETVVQPRIIASGNGACRPRLGGRRCDEIIAPAPSFGPLAAPSLATDKELSDFLKSVEKRAWKRAVYAVRDEDAALDIVQDAMIRLSEKYIDRPAAELPLLFQRIVSNATMDWFRRQKVRNAVVRNFSDFEGAAGGDGDFDLLETLESLGSSLEHESAADSVSRAQILQLDRGRGRSPARHVNARRFSCVTGRNSMSPRQPPPWAVRRAASRRTARGQSTPWPRPSGRRESEHEHVCQDLRPRRPRGHRIALCEKYRRPPQRAGGERRPGDRRASALRAREGARGAAGWRAPAPRCRRHRRRRRRSSASAARPGGSGSPRCCRWRRWSAAWC